MATEIEKDIYLWKTTIELFEPIIDEVKAPPITDVKRVLGFLFNRVWQAGEVLVVMRRNNVTFQNPAAVLLRSMYDATLQGLYLVHNPSAAPSLARDYLEFQDVDRHILIKKIERHDSVFAKAILNSPKRPAAEAEMHKRLATTASHFTRSNGRYFENWYKLNLREIAVKLDLADEYDLIISQLNACVHSSPITLGSASFLPSNIGCFTPFSY